MLKVQDIMTRNVIGIAENTPIDVAAWLLASEEVSGAPVYNAHGNLVGVLSRSDLSDPRRIESKDHAVADAMTLGAWAVHPKDPALDAVHLMLDKGIHRVLVVSGPGQVAGIVSATDILRALADGRFSDLPMSAFAASGAGGERPDESSEADRDSAGEPLARSLPR